MASSTPTAPTTPLSSGGGRGAPPLFLGGGGGGRPSPGFPDFRTRLRRARLGLAVALTPIVMLFVSFTSAYIVRQGLPTLAPHTNRMVRDWTPIALPTLPLAINTCMLLLSSLSLELARRQLARQAALVPVGSIPGVSLGKEGNFPWLGLS